MTVEGFLKRKSKLIAVYIQSLNSTPLPVLVTESTKINAKESQVTTSNHHFVKENADLKEKASLVKRTKVIVESSEKKNAGSKNSNPVALHFSDSRLFPKGPGLKPNASLKNYFMQLTHTKKVSFYYLENFLQIHYFINRVIIIYLSQIRTPFIIMERGGKGGTGIMFCDQIGYLVF